MIFIIDKKMSWYKRIYRYLLLYLVTMPFFLGYLFYEMSDWDLNLNNIKDMLLIWFIVYVVWIALFLIVFIWYSIYLARHKILFEIDQLFRIIKKKLKIKRKKIWNNPIIIQFGAPKWITSSEVAYLYSMKHFKWNISCLFYKWAAEKRILMSFIKWKMLSFDKVEIKILDDSLNNMSQDEIIERNLLFEKNKSIVLPNIELLKKIPQINIITAKSCLDKWLIEKWFTFTITEKAVEIFFVVLCIMSVMWFIWFSYATSYLKMFQDWWWWMYMIIFALVMVLFFWVLISGSAFEKTKIVKYRLSEKWKKILAEIYWYKYFLEACDEKIINKFLQEDPTYMDKVMPYAIAIWVETEVIKAFAPKLFDGINLNRYVWNLNSLAKTILMSSECTILFEKDKKIKSVKRSKKKKYSKWKPDKHLKGDSYENGVSISF